MSRRVLTVAFYRVQEPKIVAWKWNDAVVAPVEGQFVAPPASGSRWRVKACTWIDADQCNVLVEDYERPAAPTVVLTPVPPESEAPTTETVRVGRRRAER